MKLSIGTLLIGFCFRAATSQEVENTITKDMETANVLQALKQDFASLSNEFASLKAEVEASKQIISRLSSQRRGGGVDELPSTDSRRVRGTDFQRALKSSKSKGSKGSGDSCKVDTDSCNLSKLDECLSNPVFSNDACDDFRAAIRTVNLNSTETPPGTCDVSRVTATAFPVGDLTTCDASPGGSVLTIETMVNPQLPDVTFEAFWTLPDNYFAAQQFVKARNQAENCGPNFCEPDPRCAASYWQINGDTLDSGTCTIFYVSQEPVTSPFRQICGIGASEEEAKGPCNTGLGQIDAVNWYVRCEGDQGGCECNADENASTCT